MTRHHTHHNQVLVVAGGGGGLRGRHAWDMFALFSYLGESLSCLYLIVFSFPGWGTTLRNALGAAEDCIGNIVWSTGLSNTMAWF